MICPVIVEVEAKSLSESPEIINEHLIQLVASDNNDMPVFVEVAEFESPKKNKR